MVKFKKDFSIKIISLAISIILLFTSTLYPSPSKDNLRLPIGTEDDTCERMEDINNKLHTVAGGGHSSVSSGAYISGRASSSVKANVNRTQLPAVQLLNEIFEAGKHTTAENAKRAFANIVQLLSMSERLPFIGKDILIFVSSLPEFDAYGDRGLFISALAENWPREKETEPTIRDVVADSATPPAVFLRAIEALLLFDIVITSAMKDVLTIIQDENNDPEIKSACQDVLNKDKYSKDAAEKFRKAAISESAQKWTEAAGLYAQAAGLYLKLGKKLQAAESFFYAARSYYSAAYNAQQQGLSEADSLYQKAMECMRAAKGLYLQIKQIGLLFTLLAKSGRQFYDAQKLKLAAIFNENSGLINQEISNTQQAQVKYFHAAGDYENANCFKEAGDCYRKAAELADIIESRGQHACSNMARAAQSYFKAQEFSRAAECSLQLAEWNRIDGKIPETKDAYTWAKKEYKLAGDKQNEQMCVSRINSLTGNRSGVIRPTPSASSSLVIVNRVEQVSAEEKLGLTEEYILKIAGYGVTRTGI